MATNIACKKKIKDSCNIVGRTKAKPNLVCGLSLIEVVVGVAIIAIALIGLITTYNAFLEVALKNTKKIQSAYLLEEGVEAIRSMRDKSWNNVSGLSAGVNYGLVFVNGVWATSTNKIVDNDFYRNFETFDVYRDGNDDIASNGTLDPGTKFFTVSVEWLAGSASTTKSISFYLAEIF